MITHSGRALVDPYIVFDKVGLAKGMRVADLGCGRTGHFVFPAAKIVGGMGIVYAVDVVKNVLENISSMARDEGYDNVRAVWSDIEKFGKTPTDSGSSEVQVALLCEEILNLTKHLQKHPHDFTSKRGLICMISKRRKLLSYLEKNDRDRYKSIIEKLKLRK